MTSDEEDYEYDYSSDEDNMEWNSTIAPTTTTKGAGENPNAPPSFAAVGSKTGISMLPADQLVPEMKSRLKDVTEILDVPETVAAALLQEHNWSKEGMLEVYYVDATKLLEKCGVYHRCNPKPILKSKDNTCTICYDSMKGEDTLAMPCGHEFCMGCWNGFCTNAVLEGPACVRATCPQADCNEILTGLEVKKAAPESYQKFENYQLRNFVESNKLTRWCPGNGCERVACAASASAVEHGQSIAHCDSCELSFCIMCGEEPHAPCECKDLQMWNEKCRNESETANWILANTKSCPKCYSRIEKNSGCNHMTCQRCRHEFCWICMGNWDDHGTNTGGYYKCNKFTPDGSGSDVDNLDQSESARAKRELDRYLHYYKRFHAHAQAQKFAKKQLKETEARMVMLQDTSDDTRWSDVEFLKTANEQLVECRRVLKYTYAYAYYMKPSTTNEKERFEHHQEMLERFTENLSEISEKPLDEMDRTDVVNQTRVVDRFMNNVLQYVDDGMGE